MLHINLYKDTGMFGKDGNTYITFFSFGAWLVQVCFPISRDTKKVASQYLSHMTCSNMNCSDCSGQPSHEWTVGAGLLTEIFVLCMHDYLSVFMCLRYACFSPTWLIT